MKVAIIGVGLYGAYIAFKLNKIGNVSVDLFEKNKKILDSTAKKNQYRLHTGYHYPRSKETILQTIEGYNLFKREFKNFIYFPKKNYYLVHKESLVNYQKYLKLYNGLKLKFKKININNCSKYLDIKQFSGCMNTEEGVILIDKLIAYFRKKLKKKNKIYLGSNVDQIDSKKGYVFLNKKKFKKYDLIINTTYTNPNLGLKKNKFRLKFELTGMVKILKPFDEQLGITIMDGQFCSLYPQNKKESTISSVKYTPIYKSTSFKKINDKIKSLNKNKIKKKIIYHAAEFLKIKYYKLKPKLILSHKVKLRNDQNDIRTSSIKFENKLISILCGKIDAAPVIYKKIQKIIEGKLRYDQNFTSR